jgi:hypothetical protein
MQGYRESLQMGGCAKFLCGHSIRKNARFKESYDEQVKFATDVLA